MTIGSLAACAVAVVAVLTLLPGGGPELVSETAFAQTPGAEAVSDLTPVETSTADLSTEVDPNSETLEKLQEPISVKMIELPLVDAINVFAHDVELQFHLDQRALDEVGIAPDSLVTFSMQDVPAEMALRLLLDQLDLSFMLDHGLVIVTSPEQVAQKLETRCYPIGDLGPVEIQVSDTSLRGMEEGYGEEPTANNLIRLIQTSVEADSWTETDGSGSITIFRDVLVVQQSWPVHRKIELLLEQLREALDLKFSAPRATRLASPATPRKSHHPSAVRSSSGNPPVDDDPFSEGPSPAAADDPFGAGSLSPAVDDDPFSEGPSPAAADDPFGAASPSPAVDDDPFSEGPSPAADKDPFGE